MITEKLDCKQKQLKKRIQTQVPGCTPTPKPELDRNADKKTETAPVCSAVKYELVGAMIKTIQDSQLFIVTCCELVTFMSLCHYYLNIVT